MKIPNTNATRIFKLDHHTLGLLLCLYEYFLKVFSVPCSISDVLKSDKTNLVFYDAFNLICVAATISPLIDYWRDRNR